MAKKDIKTVENTEKLRNQSSLVVHGTDTVLDDENIQIKNIVKQTVIETKKKIGERTNGKPINYFNELNFGKAFSEIFANKADKNSESKESEKDFKKMMQESNRVDIGALMLEDSRSLIFNNYRIIQKHIPECASALEIYKDNIISPDDYTKLMFNIKYDKKVEKDILNSIKDRLDKITLKYSLEEKADNIIEESLLLGESYIAVLSLEDELSAMLDDKTLKPGSILSESVESIRLKDLEHVNVLLEASTVKMNDEEMATFNELFGTNLTLDEAKNAVANIINENVEIGSKKELLLERVDAEIDKHKNDIDINFNNDRKKSKKKPDSKPLYVNGTAIRKLVPERVVELRIDDICYGYYYAEETGNIIPQSSYLGISSGRDAKGAMNLAQNNTISSTSGGTYTPATSAANQLGIGEQKLKLISDVFLNSISNKIDKEFVRNNKQFKDFIYDLVRQDYIIKKGIKLTYFRPEEVIKFECEPVYKDIIFFAKLYIAILTNNLLIKLGRSHDKRIFYVNVGADAKYEEAINSVIQDIKTKDYAMESLNDFNTLLNLTPGRFDDYFMPTVNGDRPIDIDTLPGMDVDMNNEFVEYLKNSLMSGMGVPRNLIDTTSDVDFARSISAMNSNFVRSVIKYQKKFTTPFTRLYQKIYENEYRFANNEEASDTSLIDISSIKVSFPSPATLAMTNILDQLQAADQNAEYISSQILPIDGDQLNEKDRISLKAEIVKDLVPSIEWSKYEEFVKDIRLKRTKQELEPKIPEEGMDGMYQGY